MAPKTRVQFKELVPDAHRAYPFLADKRGTIEDQYDTFETGKPFVWDVNRLFCLPQGQQGRTHADTNAQIAGMLGMPRYAVWTYLRVFFEDWDDGRAFCARTTLQLANSCGSKIIWRGTLSTMSPYLPRGGADKLRSVLRNGRVQFWPWIEAKIAPTLIDAHDPFSVELQDNSGGYRGKVRGKVILGPYIFRPIG